MRIQYFKVIQGDGRDLEMASSSTKRVSYLYDINSSGYLDEGNVSPASISIEAPDIVQAGNYTDIILIKQYNLLLLSYYCYLEMNVSNCTIDTQSVLQIECNCTVQNGTYQVILKSVLIESNGNLIVNRAMCENKLQIPIQPGLFHDLIIFQVRNNNGTILQEYLHFEKSVSVKEGYTNKSTTTKGSARKNNGIIYVAISIHLIK